MKTKSIVFILALVLMASIVIGAKSIRSTDNYGCTKELTQTGFNLICNEEQQEETFNPTTLSVSQSELQAFYFIESVSLNNNELDNQDYIIAYRGNIVVGYRTNIHTFDEIPVMGYNGNNYTMGYMKQNEIPTFKLYDASRGILIDLTIKKSNYNNGDNLYFSNNIMPFIQLVE